MTSTSKPTTEVQVDMLETITDIKSDEKGWTLRVELTNPKDFGRTIRAVDIAIGGIAALVGLCEDCGIDAQSVVNAVQDFRKRQPQAPGVISGGTRADSN